MTIKKNSKNKEVNDKNDNANSLVQMQKPAVVVMD